MLKPGVNRTVHHFTAPLIWSVVGSILFFRGYNWVAPGEHLMVTVLALVAGTVKSLFVLDRTAVRTVKRIAGFQDGTCLGAVYSWKSWLLAGSMMVFGIILRHLIPPGTFLGWVYCTIGWALFFSSRHGWFAWLKQIRHNAFTQ